MANPLMYADVGVTVLEGVTNFLSARTDYRLNKAIQKHQEVMRGISAALARNTINQNRVRAGREAVYAAIGIDAQSAADMADARVSAAAAGVEGVSVQEGLADLRRSRLLALTGLGEAVSDVNASYADQERTLALDMIYSRDTTPITRPSVLGHLLDTSTKTMDAYDRNQPKGSKLTDRLERLADGYRE